ncbi:MAG: Xaa-Pro peptidase family protein [Candidatus Hydrogenedentes bacterium]|nr:Xaa-Pro peptidase family protein [Candidatus Hydrogenedentota bacterium]
MTRLEGLRRRMTEARCDAFVSFAPPSNQYLTGFRGTTSAVIITASEAQFLCDFRYIEQAEEMVDKAFSIEQMAGSLIMRAGERLEQLGARVAAFEPSYMTVAELRTLRKHFTHELKEVDDIVLAGRRIKDSAEVEAIRAAQSLAESVLEEVTAQLRVGQTEQEVAAQFEYGFRKRGATGPSFESIVLFGSRCSLPHGQPGPTKLREQDTVLLDFGCRLNGYCSDLTRTYAFGSLSDLWFEEIYRLTLTAQRKALESIKPGMRGREVDAIARAVIEDGGHGKHFGHGLGHGVGIEIHEGPRLNIESETVLQPGMVVTVEPGIYLPGQGGVRIEDLVVVTESGYENLTTAPKELRVLGT